MVIQPDVLREPEDKFLQMIETCEKLVRKTKKHITGGIKATKPIMGIDYMKLGDSVKDIKDMQVFKIDSFVERLSNLKETQELVNNFYVTTHSNHSCWFPELMLNAYKKYRPDWYESLMQIKEAFGKPNEKELIDSIYSKMETGSTEEVTKHIFSEGYLVLLPFKWSDVGTWNSIYDYYGEGVLKLKKY